MTGGRCAAYCDTVTGHNSFEATGLIPLIGEKLFALPGEPRVWNVLGPRKWSVVWDKGRAGWYCGVRFGIWAAGQLIDQGKLAGSAIPMLGTGGLWSTRRADVVLVGGRWTLRGACFAPEGCRDDLDEFEAMLRSVEGLG